MKVLYITTATSKKKYEEVFKLTNGNMKHAIQNFHSGIIKGLQENDFKDITVLSGIPISHKNTKKMFFKYDVEKENNVKYNSLPFINLPVFKQLFIIFSLIILVLKWIFESRKEEKIIITDAAYVSVNPIVIILKQLFQIKTITVVADIYNYMSENVEKNTKRSLIKKLLCKINNYCFKNYDGFVLLTKKMNDVVNIKNKPYIIMEGIIDSDKYKNQTINKKQKIKNIVYTGSFNSKFGILELVDDFMKIKDKNIELHLYGNGNSLDYVIECSKKDSRIKYMGIVDQQQLLKIQKDAYILINPRQNKAEFTKYSFPSKTMEYMASGTPVLMYKLDGIPKDYYEHFYEIKKSIKNSIEEVIKKSDKELEEKGIKAKEFVLKNKNSKNQVSKIVNLIKSLFTKKKIIETKTSKLLNVYLVVLPILFIFLTRNTLYSLLLVGIRESLVILAVFCIPLFCIYFYRIIKKKCNTRNLIIFLLFLLFILISIIMKKDFKLINFSLIFILCSTFIYSQLIDFKKFCNIYIKIILYLCITSLFCQYIAFPLISKVGLFETLKDSIFYMENSVGTPFLNMIVSFVVYSDHFIRNFSIFTEPAYFQFYLIFALMIVYFLPKDKYQKVKLGILLITLLSTFSASAYVSIVFFVPYIIYDIYNMRYAIWGFIRYGSVILFLIFYYLMISSNMFRYFILYSLNKLTGNSSSFTTRFDGLKNTIEYFFRNPIFGTKITELMGSFRLCNSLPAMFSIYGIVVGLFFVYYMIKCSFNFDNRKYLIFIAFIIIAVSSNLHIFIYTSSFWLLIFSGLMEKEEVK